MIRRISIFLFFSIHIFAYSQELILDGSFETNWSKPNYVGQVYFLYNWNNVNKGRNVWPFASPDYFSLNGTNQGQLPNTWNGYITPKDGIAIVGLVFTNKNDSLFREYISSELSQPLKVGKYYRLRFGISNANKDSLAGESTSGCNCVQMAFTDKALFQKDHEPILLDNPTLSIDTILFKSDWFQVDYTFKAISNARFITIGNFKKNGTFNIKDYKGSLDERKASAYYFFDSLSLMETYHLQAASSTKIEVCENEKVTLKATGDYSYKWTDLANPSAILSLDSSLTIYPFVDKKYKLMGTKDSILYSISTILNPTISTQDTSFCLGDSVIITAKGRFANFEWQEGSNEQAKVIKESTTLTLIARNKQCETRKTIVVSDKICAIEIAFPNVITPNQDDVNDTFRPLKYLGIKQASVRILNRWGSEIGNFNNMELGWKADNIPDGIYFWECTYVTVLEKKETIKGIVQIIR